MASESFKEFKRICQGKKIEEEKKKKKWWLSVPRFISIYITWILVKTPISPNFITILGIILGLTGLILIGFANAFLIILGFILIYIYFILDEVDGEIARYKKKTSVQGIFYDEIGHILFQTGLFFSLGFSLYLISSDELFIILGSGLSFFLLGIRIIRRISIIASTKISIDNINNLNNQDVKTKASRKKSIKIFMFIFRNILTAFCTAIIITTTFFVGFLLFIYFDNFKILEYILKGYFVFMFVMFLVFMVSRAKSINKDAIRSYLLMKE